MEDKDLLIKYVNVNLLQSEVIVLKDVNLDVRKGDFIYLIGKVGSGKSTLLKSFYAEVPIASGEEARIFDYNLKKIKRSQIPYLRRKLGIVYQDFQLLIDRTIHDNLMFVLKATGWKKKDAEKRIDEVLKLVGMENKGYKMPHQLSGGEQQRIVIARAMLNKPDIILADEPTGHLDPGTGKDIIELLRSICKNGTTMIMSTHNLNWLDMYPGRVIRFGDEKLVEIDGNGNEIAAEPTMTNKDSKDEDIDETATDTEEKEIANQDDSNNNGEETHQSITEETKISEEKEDESSTQTQKRKISIPRREESTDNETN